MFQDAIRAYHDLLTDDVAAASQTQLDSQQRGRGLFFGERPLCTVLRPRFLTSDQFRFLQQCVRLLLPAFDKAYRAAIADATLRAQLGLLPQEEELMGYEPRFACPFPTSRLDAFFVSEQELYFTEYNTETPAGAAYNDVLTEVFFGLPVMGAFLRRYRVVPLPARPGVLHALLDAYQQWLGRREPPRIAIVDWREVPTFSEFVLFAEYFKSQGLPCVIADPREVEYRNGRLFAGDFHISLIYKRVLIDELLERGGLDHPLVRAVRDGAVCMVNPCRCKILYKKASLAVLSDERSAPLFTAAQRQAIAAHIPWTRRIEERHTEYAGQTIDLIPFVLRNRERFLLKPNDAYGGKGIVLGWQVDADVWEKAVTAALAEPFIVQQRINLPRETFPHWSEGRVCFIDPMLDTNPFICNGEYMDACLTRISTEDLLNVTAGGGSTVPTFLIEERC
jgi:hypothetical protein